MTDRGELWFERELGQLSRWGGMLYASRPDGPWAILHTDRTFPDSVDLESDELLGLYGSLAHGIGHMLLGRGVRVPRSLEDWSVAPEMPMAELGSWTPRLVVIHRSLQLALARDFDSVRVLVTTRKDEHLTILVPASEPVVPMRYRVGLDILPPQEG